ncbi:acyltransferase [Ilumatobacter coccineus]|uniref:Putative sugar acetyltransferase n=1 Tax=Ilumatobacter coccineus (strain NBRC 103263 / KCTC 29153 / YM16-304) TaxID=1313172 RepID=A0A6C7E976_ILUCY|nr:DapH/DapD/GlmU-related protein [Ilumatobacter coccineus]BAN01769.1 putative sugar acetyltransferase [Ilumatobacter coccineus YM16-304]
MTRIITVLREEFAPASVVHRRMFAVWLANRLPNAMFVRVRTALFRVAGIEIGHGSAILGRVRVWGAESLSIGRNTTLSPPVAICLDAAVEIGDGVLIGHDTILATGRHEIGPADARGGPLAPEPITIGNGVWIGASVLILPGVTIGDGAVVAGGAVVTADVAANTIVGGVPASVLRSL